METVVDWRNDSTNYHTEVSSWRPCCFFKNCGADFIILLYDFTRAHNHGQEVKLTFKTGVAIAIPSTTVPM